MEVSLSYEGRIVQLIRAILVGFNKISHVCTYVKKQIFLGWNRIASSDRSVF